MELQENTQLNIAMRKARVSLIASGRSVIIFSAWVVLKTLLSFFYGEDMAPLRNLVYSDELMMRIVAIIVFSILLVVYLWIHMYIGFSALDEAHERRRHKLFHFWTFVLMVFITAGIAARLVAWWKDKSAVTYILSSIVDATLLAAMVDMLGASIALRRCQKIKQEQE